MNTTIKSITTLIGNQSIPAHEIQKACHHRLNKITILAENMNYIYAPIKIQFGTRRKLGIIRIQISQDITDDGNDIVKNKGELFKNTRYTSMLLDESIIT